LIIITGGRLCKGAAVCFIWCRISGCNQPHRKHIAVYRSRCKCLTVYIRYSCNGFYWYRKSRRINRIRSASVLVSY
jgi:hypothetical protein